MYELRQLLNEDSSSTFLDDKTSYGFIRDAAVELVKRTQCLRTTQSITTVADQTNYALNADFLAPYLKDDSGEIVIKYNDGSVTTFLPHQKYDDIFIANNTTSVATPQCFSIIDRPTMYSRITGTCTSAGAVSATTLEATLTDSGGDFSNASVGDVIHNTTDASDGYILSKTSTTVIVTVLFDSVTGTTAEKDWDSSDAYVIQPQGRLDLVLDPPPSTSGHTITVPYIQRPDPVFAPFRSYRFQAHYMEPLVKYAAWLYKFRDREQDFGHAYYQMFDRGTRMNANSLNKALNRKGFTVNLKGRR